MTRTHDPQADATGHPEGCEPTAHASAGSAEVLGGDDPLLTLADLAIGMVVSLRSGGPLMTVNARSVDDGNDPWVATVWFHEGQFTAGRFAPQLLRKWERAR